MRNRPATCSPGSKTHSSPASSSRSCNSEGGFSEEFLEKPPSLLQDLLDEAGEEWVFEPGEQVAGRFRIVRWLAHGGMGEVYEAEDHELPGVRVALKTVRGHIAWSESLRQQFRREVELARKVTHPNVCRIYDLI